MLLLDAGQPPPAAIGLALNRRSQWPSRRQLFGEDRKCLASAQTAGFDPKRSSHWGSPPSAHPSNTPALRIVSAAAGERCCCQRTSTLSEGCEDAARRVAHESVFVL